MSSNIIKPNAMMSHTMGQTTKPKPNPFFDSPTSDEYNRFSSQNSPLDVMRTPGSGTGSAFSPVKPSMLIEGWDTPVTPVGTPKSDKENSTSLKPPMNIDEKNLPPSNHKVKGTLGEKMALSKKVKETLEEKKALFRKNIEQVKKNVPKPINPLKREHKKNSADLADLSLVTISIVPRLGCGMSSGRMPFERMRTSLMLHLMQEIKTKSWTKHEVAGEDNWGLDQNGLISRLNNMLYDCIASGATFVEKTQEIVKVSRETVEEIKDRTDKSFTKTELGRRNLLAAKFLSSGYREIVNDEKLVPTIKDGLSMMIVAGAYYALGKFGAALEVYQRAGVELKKKIVASSPEYIMHCTKLFNNMGCVYFEMKEYDKAMKTWQRALELCNDDDEDYALWTAASVLDQASIMNNMVSTLKHFC